MSSKKILVTCADKYMGSAVVKKFKTLDYDVFADCQELVTQTQCAGLIQTVGDIDVLVLNLAEPPKTAPVQSIKNEDWHVLFKTLVDPLMFLVRAAVPQMLKRQSGKIIAITSAAPLKGIANNAAYCSARGAQNAFIKAVGIEMARSGIQVNAIAQNYINNDTYYPDQLLSDDKFLDHVRRNVPTNKVGLATETSELAAYLANENCNHMVGQVIPLAGGWIS